MENHTHTHLSKEALKYRRKKHAEDMKRQVITFVLMIFLTVIAFFAVGYDGYSKWFVKPFILLLAIIQVIFQLYYFMHMSQKGHGTIATFLYTGLLIGLSAVVAFVLIVWI
jgi:cytochrome c oxidase subunit IV